MTKWALILAGGDSSRMGTQKSGLIIAGVPVIQRIINSLNHGGISNIILSTKDGDMISSEIEINGIDHLVADVVGWNGPQSGLVSGLRHANSQGVEWIQITACDLPFLDSSLFELLEQRCSDAVDIIIPTSAAGKQPLISLVRISAMLDALDMVAKEGQSSVFSLLPKLRCLEISSEELYATGIADSCFLNLNSPEQLKLAEDIIQDLTYLQQNRR